MKKYYVWYTEAWDSPQRLSIFRNLEDFIDFIAITCTDRGYEISNVEVDNDADDCVEYDDYEKKFGEQYVKEKTAVLGEILDYCYCLYRTSEKKYFETESLKDNARRAAAWNYLSKFKSMEDKK